MSPAYDKRQLLKSAYNYAQSGQWDRALDEYRRTSKLFPDDANILSMIADLLVKKGESGPGAQSYLEAARLHKDQGNDDKELASIRKALKVQSGNAEAAARLDSHFQRVLARATGLLAQGKYDPAAELAQKLLDADPGHLQVNKLLDEIRAKRMQEEAVQAFQEEERLAAAVAPATDATKAVMERLTGTAQKYLAAEDYDNAIETLLIMVKIEPGRMEIREQLEQAQEQLKKRQQAQNVWRSILKKDSDRVDVLKDEGMSAKEMAEWAGQEQAMREKLARELQAQEEAAQAELGIIENAMKEIRQKSTAAPGEAPKAVSPADQSRLRALETERKQLEQRLDQEREEAIERERLLQEQARLDADKLRHAMELERMELEAKARVEALKELQGRMDAERQAYEQRLQDERRRSAEAEAAMRSQLQELMREEMTKLRSEMKEQSMKEIQGRLEEEQRLREKVEKDIRSREAEAVSRLSSEQKFIEAERKKAEEKIRKERDAIENLKVEEELRKHRIVEEAMKRRGMRAGLAGTEEKQNVIKASKRISEALHNAATKHMESDLDKMLDTARRYLDQDLLLDAMRICQKITAMDPENEKVKVLLKEIYVKKGL